MARPAIVALCLTAAVRVMAAPTLGMDFGPPSRVIVNGGVLTGKASNTLDLYPHGFAYSGAEVQGKRMRRDGVEYTMAPFSVDGGKTFLNSSFTPSYQGTWTSFAYFNTSGHLWAHDFGCNNTLLVPASRNSTSISSNSTFTYRFENGVLTRTPGPRVTFSGFTNPFCAYDGTYTNGGLALYASGHILLPDGTHLQTGITRWCPPPSSKTCNAIVAFTSKDGYNYKYVSNVSTCIETPSVEDGPNEHDCTLLSTGDVICVFRTASGYERGGGGTPFYMAKSSDGGKSWSKPVALMDLDGNAMGCARPHLLQLGSSTLLVGGRTMMGRDYNDGFGVWLSEDAGKTWSHADVSYHHNAKANINNVPLVPAAVNTTKGTITKGWMGTSGYAGLVRVGEMSAFLLYDWEEWASGYDCVPELGANLHDLHPLACDWTYAMRIDLVSAMRDGRSSDVVV